MKSQGLSWWSFRFMPLLNDAARKKLYKQNKAKQSNDSTMQAAAASYIGQLKSYTFFYMANIHLLIKSLIIYRCHCHNNSILYFLKIATVTQNAILDWAKQRPRCTRARCATNMLFTVQLTNMKIERFIFVVVVVFFAVVWIIGFWIRLTSIKTILMHFSFCI